MASKMFSGDFVRVLEITLFFIKKKERPKAENQIFGTAQLNFWEYLSLNLSPD